MWLMRGELIAYMQYSYVSVQATIVLGPLAMRAPAAAAAGRCSRQALARLLSAVADLLASSCAWIPDFGINNLVVWLWAIYHWRLRLAFNLAVRATIHNCRKTSLQLMGNTVLAWIFN